MAGAIATPRKLERRSLRENASGYAPDTNHEGRIDAQRGIVFGVKICGTKSDNKRRYEPQALKAAIPLYQRAPVRFDHRKKGDSPSERPTATTFGWLENVHQEADGSLFGDLHFLTEHERAPAFIEMVQRNPRLWGLSHDASGSGYTDEDGVFVVRAIEGLNEVSIVNTPATCMGLFESQGDTSIALVPVKSVLESLTVDLRLPVKQRRFLLEAMDEDGGYMANMASEGEGAPQMEAPGEDMEPVHKLREAYKALANQHTDAALDGDDGAMKAHNALVKHFRKVSGGKAPDGDEDEPEEEEETPKAEEKPVKESEQGGNGGCVNGGTDPKKMVDPPSFKKHAKESRDATAPKPGTVTLTEAHCTDLCALAGIDKPSKELLESMLATGTTEGATKTLRALKQLSSGQPAQPAGRKTYGAPRSSSPVGATRPLTEAKAAQSADDLLGIFKASAGRN